MEGIIYINDIGHLMPMSSIPWGAIYTPFYLYNIGPPGVFLSPFHSLLKAIQLKALLAAFLHILERDLA